MSSEEVKEERKPRGRFVCYNCGQEGHLARECSNPRIEGQVRDKLQQQRIKARRCFNCGRFGHMSADCDQPAGNKACYNCMEEGHIARDCPNPRKDNKSKQQQT